MSSASDHVSIGTDQQVTPGSLQDYTQWAQLVAAMLSGGFTTEQVGKIVGGNRWACNARVARGGHRAGAPLPAARASSRENPALRYP